MQSFFDIVADLDTPVSAYLKLASLKPRFLLESVEGGKSVGRYSFLGFGETREFHLGQAGDPDESFFVSGQCPEQLLSAFRRALNAAPRLYPELPNLPFNGGLVGVSAYDLIRHFEKLPDEVKPSRYPRALYLATDSLLVFDHLTRRAALLHSGNETERKELRRDVLELLSGSLSKFRVAHSSGAAGASMSRGEFMAAVDLAKGNITDGDVYQLVLSVQYCGRTSISPFTCYRALRLINPSPYMYFLDLGEVAVAGSSPEALVRKKGNVATLRPIAGTRPRHPQADRDLELERELLADPKEAAEHVMLVDLARNDLGRVATPGSIRVDPYRSIERYSHVMHLVSGVSGELESGKDCFDLFAAAFPAGTLVGAPKIRAMELISQYEPVNRNLYAGTVGYFSHNGNMDHAITIRTFSFAGDEYQYQAGAGIVADSVPCKEYDEVLAKSAVFGRALELAEEIR
jgi:anthranilate synthase component 1